jgi:hypothetical protein
VGVDVVDVALVAGVFAQLVGAFAVGNNAPGAITVPDASSHTRPARL